VKYAAFTRIISGYQQGFYPFSVRDLFPWANQWLSPHWQVSYDPDKKEISFFYGSYDENSKPLFSENFLKYKNNNQLINAYHRKSEQEKVQIAEKALTLLDEVDRPQTDFPPFDENLGENFNEVFEEIKAVKKSDKPQGLTWNNVKKYVKLLLFVNLTEMVKVGQINLEPIVFATWVGTWMQPEWAVLNNLEIQGVDFYERVRSDESEKAELLFQSRFINIHQQAVIASRFQGFSKGDITFITQVTHLLGNSLAPPEKIDPLDNPDLNYQYFFQLLEIMIPGVDSHVDITGIGMIDSGLATEWHKIQLCKLWMAIFLSAEIITRDRRIAHLPSYSFLACAKWCSLWLIPHWNLEIMSIDENSPNKDVSIRLYPISEASQTQENHFYEGDFRKFIEQPTEVVKISEQIDPDQYLLHVSKDAIQQFGNAMPTISEDGEIRIIDDGFVEIPGTAGSYEDIRVYAEYNDKMLAKLIESE
jgi:hypothetical protein